MNYSRILGCLIAAILMSSRASPMDAMGKPNIVIILADDLGYGDVGCYGDTRIETPNIDALAADGLRFTDFHSNGAVCSPTRAALLTGRYQQRSGITGVVTAAGHRHTGLDLQETTFAEVLQEVGYTTALFGKWHLGYRPDYNPVRQGFDEYVGFVSGNIDYHAHLDQTGAEDWWKQDELVPETGYSTDLITDHGVDFILRHRDKPFLLYLAHEAPHYPYQGRRDPPRYTREDGRTLDPATPEAYKEMVEVMDEGIGRIRRAIEEAGLSGNTLIFFWSDNGPAKMGSAGPLRGKKNEIWEGGHRVPAVAFWPGRIRAGDVTDETAMGMDLFPTMVDLAGASLPEGLELDGVSLVPHLIGEKPLAPRPVFWGVKTMLAVRQGDLKLVTDVSFTDPVLYDLQADRAETTDLAGQKPEEARELLDLLRDWHREVNEGVEPRTD